MSSKVVEGGGRLEGEIVREGGDSNQDGAERGEAKIVATSRAQVAMNRVDDKAVVEDAGLRSGLHVTSAGAARLLYESARGTRN